MAESEEELKRLLMKVKEESEKVDLKLNIQKTKIMTSSPITSWQIDGETVEKVSDFLFGGCKIMHRQWPRVPGCNGTGMAKSSYPASVVSGSREETPRV